MILFNKKLIKACRVIKFKVKKRPRRLCGSTLHFRKHMALVANSEQAFFFPRSSVMLRTDARTEKKAKKYKTSATWFLN